MELGLGLVNQLVNWSLIGFSAIQCDAVTLLTNCGRFQWRHAVSSQGQRSRCHVAAPFIPVKIQLEHRCNGVQSDSIPLGSWAFHSFDQGQSPGQRSNDSVAGFQSDEHREWLTAALIGGCKWDTVDERSEVKGHRATLPPSSLESNQNQNDGGIQSTSIGRFHSNQSERWSVLNFKERPRRKVKGQEATWPDLSWMRAMNSSEATRSLSWNQIELICC